MFQSAYVFGPWTFPEDRPDFAYRAAPREDDRAEVWLHVPDDGSAPYWAGCFAGMDTSIEFRDGSVTTLEDACRALDTRIGAAGHYLYERLGERPDLSELVDLPSCGDCPVGGRDGDGPVCPRSALCDRECAEQDAAYELA